MEGILKIEKLKYNNILKDITFSLDEKSFNILVGNNGSGKTTLVNCIRGLINYRGNITLLNHSIKKEENYKNIGFFTEENIVFETIIFDELVNILKNIGYDEEVAKKRVYTISKKLGVSHFMYKKQEKLTNNQIIIFNFICSIIHEPRVLIIDRNFETLDENSKNNIFTYIKSQKKLTTLFITTNSEYFYLADNFIFLKDGKIIEFIDKTEISKNEKTFIKCGSNLPFNIDLSNKLMAYELLKQEEFDIVKMVDEIWK